MNDPSKQRQPLVGPPSWANWRAMYEGAPTSGAVEVPFYSDAWTIGEVTTGLGPYQFFNTVAVHHGHGIVRTAVVVRLELHMEFDNQDPDKTDAGVYHGGGLVDELAALASLLTGARFRAGGQSRRFEPTDGPRGRPIAWDPRPEPTLPVSVDGIVLPTCGGAHSLMPLEQLTIYPTTDARDAISVVRAARLYQDALWVAESEPNLAWIMLVSAVEAAANRWQTSKDEPLLRLRSANPDLVEYLDSTNIEGLAERIAAEFADAIGSTRKFVEFLMAHYPRHLRHDRWSRGRSHGTTPKCVGRFASSMATDRERYTTAFHFLRLYVVRLLTSAPMEWFLNAHYSSGPAKWEALGSQKMFRCSCISSNTSLATPS